jgi:hypothetical protein
MASRRTMAMAMGKAKAKAAVPAKARTTRISWLAYAVEDMASDANTARPTTLPKVSFGASAVDRGRPISHERAERRGGVCCARRCTGVPFRSSRLRIAGNVHRVVQVQSQSGGSPTKTDKRKIPLIHCGSYLSGEGQREALYTPCRGLSRCVEARQTQPPVLAPASGALAPATLSNSALIPLDTARP